MIDPDLTALAMKFLESNIDNIFESVKSAAKGTKHAVRSQFRSTYHAYLTRIIDRYSRSKSFFVRTEPVPLYDFFVPPDLLSQRRRLQRPTASQLAKVSPHIIVTGSAGSGKTMLIRHLLISVLMDKVKTPVLIELRSLNNEDLAIRESVLQALQLNGLNVDNAYLELALASGHFCLLFDGFDELALDSRNEVANQIKRLAEHYPGNWIILSSRPDSMLEGWPVFSSFGIAPLELDQAVELVQKLPFDETIKANFAADLRSRLFDEHRSFLSNPLLLSIMLLTYNDVAHIPTKLSIFYNQAFESLFQKHDALKGGFQRERRTELDIQDFGKAFSAFCVQSYDRRDFSFSKTTALEYLDQAKIISGLAYNSNCMLHDCIQSVSLMLEDGLDIAFAHRSFQEYFVARFIRSAHPDVKPRLVQHFARRAESDSVMQLLYELDPHTVELHYLLPILDTLRKHINVKDAVTPSHLLAYIRLTYSSFTYRPSDEEPDFSLLLGGVIKDGRITAASEFIRRNYLTGVEYAWPSNEFDEAIHRFREECDDKDQIPCESIETTSPFFEALARSDSIWGIEHLRAIIGIGDEIRRRHKDNESTLDEILKLARH